MNRKSENTFNYLGVDFGTSNCVASAFNSDGVLEFVKFEEDGTILPTVLFVPRVDVLAEEVDEKELRVRLRRAKIEEKNRYQKDISEFSSILENFDGRNKPRLPSRPDKPKAEDYNRDRAKYKAAVSAYELELSTYDVKRADYEQKLEQFKRRRKVFERQQREFIGPIAEDESLRKSLIVAMQRENSEAAANQYWNQTFFSAMSSGKSFVYGREAIRLYSSDPLSGFFMRSPKSFLAMEIKADYRNIFMKIVEKILENIKRHAERQFRRKFQGVILGRPVNYHGVRGDVGNKDALEIMREASHNVGFEKVLFFFEPVAAALSIPSARIPSGLSLVVDIGGGTTDCSMIRGKSISRLAVGLSVSRNRGTRIGGTDFDQSIAWMLLMPAFGKNGNMKSGLPLPTSIIHDAISTRDLPAQIRFRNSRYAIEELRGQVVDKTEINRLLKMQELQAQHKVIIEGERIKLLASETDRLVARLGFIEDDLEIKILRDEFDSAVRTQIEKILEQVRAIVSDEGLLPSVVFVTGGMSQSPLVLKALENYFGPDVKIERLDSMSAVGVGLGIVANNLTGGDTQSVQAVVELGLSA
jgi:hypothetical chaperone protein